MEPQKNGSAPLVGWSSVAPSLDPSPKFPSSPDYDNDSEETASVKSLPDGNCTTVFINTPEVKFDADSFIFASKSSINVTFKEIKPKIPDGGWGWVVVMSSLVISMIADGISFSFGLLYIEFLHEFGASKSTTSWIGSLFMAVPLLTGPIMSALVDRYGCRKMTIVGGIISGLGFVLSSYANSIGVMYLTFGVIAGLGLGLCYVTAVVSIAYWFDKKRNLAIGLGACGTGIGTFVYAPMTQFFIEEFGWRGATLLLAGTFFNMCVCGAVMRDPEWWIKEQNKQYSMGGRSIKNSSTSSISGKNSQEGDFPDFDEIRKLLKQGEKPEYILQTLATSLESPEEQLSPKEHCRSVVNLPTFVKRNERVPLEVLEQLSGNKKLFNLILENYPSLMVCRSVSEKGLNNLVEDLVAASTRVPVTVSVKLKKAPNKQLQRQANSLDEPSSTVPLIQNNHKVEIYNHPHYTVPPMKMDSLTWLQKHFPSNTHYLKNIKIHKHSAVYRGAMLNIHKYRLRASSCPDIYKNSMTTLAKENEEKWYEDFLELLKSMVDFSMFLELHFFLTSISTILLFTWFIVPYFYLADHLTRHSYTESEASLILSVIGVTNTIGMIFLGWAGDQSWLNVSKTYSVCIILCGISCSAMMFFTDNYTLLVVSAASFGLFFSSTFSFTPTLLVELIPLEKFTTAYGLILLCQGIGNLLGPPIAGLLFDVTGTWEQSFWQAGLWIIVSGILIGFIPCTTNRKMWGSGPIEKELASEKTSVA